MTTKWIRRDKASGIPTLLALAFLLISTNGFGQGFIEITTGDMVNDGGVSWGTSTVDYDGDGYLDIFVANNGVNFLYRGNGDSTFVKVTSGDIVTDADNSRAGSWGDYDNDGDLDLFVANNGGDNRLYQNNSDGTFTKITEGIIVNDGGSGRSCSWVDYNNDGHLDLSVTNFGQNNFLYRNNGDLTFTKITSGDLVNDGGSSTASNWIDLDNDGDLDFFVANFNQNNFLYLNNGDGTFTKITSSPVVSDGATSTGGNWGDFDNDGDIDLFVSNLSNVDNLLYTNDGPPNYSFTQVTAGDVVSQGGDSYVSSWVDHDNDGDLDLFVTNRNQQNNFLYENSGDPGYTLSSITDGILVEDGASAYGSTWGDFDNNGYLDVFVNILGQNNALYLNNGGSNHWLQVKATGVASNKSALGARIRIKATIGGTPTWQMQDISGQTGYYSQNSLEAEFGLGDATTVDSLVIDWLTPAGSVDFHTDVAVDMIFVVQQMAEPLPALASFGVCYATTGTKGDNPGSLLRIDAATGAGALIGATGLPGVSGLAIKSTGEIFVTDVADPGGLYRLDAATAAATLVASTGLFFPDAIAFDQNDLLYIVDSNNDLHTIDEVTGATNLVGATGFNIRGLAFDPTDGALWGSDGGANFGQTDRIFIIDTTTGAATLVGATGLGGSTPDLHFDQEGNLYGVKGGGTGTNNLIAIDKATGMGTVIGPVGFSAVAGMATRLEPNLAPPAEELTSLTHTPGDLNVGIFNDGSIGAANNSFAGPGVTWKAQNGIFVAGPIFGTSSTGSVNGHLGSFGINGDLTIVASNFADGFTSDADFDQIASAVIDDSGAPNPYGVEVHQISYSQAGDDFVFIRYGFVNKTSVTLSDFYAGAFADWDIGTAVGNSGGYALEEDLVYNFDPAGAPYYYGITALDGLSGMLTSTAANAAAARTEAFNNISTLDTNPIVPPGDFRTWLGSGPFLITPGDTVWVTFAVVAGDDLAGITANAGTARQKAAAIGWIDASEAKMSLAHTPGDLNVGVFNDGAIGAENVGFSGPGVTWKGQNGLFVGGLVFGTSGAGSANGLIGSFGITGDLVNVASKFSAGFTSDGDFDQKSAAVLSDAGAPAPYDVDIQQLSYSNSGEEFVFLRYAFINTSATPVQGFYAGMFIDWDIGTAVANSGGYVLDSDLVYNFDTGGAPYYYGMAALDGMAGMLTSTVGTAPGARAETFANISTLDTNPIVAPGDFRSWIGAGPYDIASGDTAWATFAIVAGDDLAEITSHANEARRKATSLGWLTPPTSVNSDDSLLPDRFALSQNYPNPFNPSTNIEYGLPKTAYVVLKIYNILGEEIRTLVQELQSPGIKSVVWDGTNNRGLGVASGIYIYQIKAGDFRSARKLMLLR